ncbi:hypothetical protein D3C78_1773220 [compost metagenome]
MLKSIQSDNFQITKMTDNLISIRVNEYANTIMVSEKQFNEFLQLIHKAESEFFPHNKVVTEARNRRKGDKNK